MRILVKTTGNFQLLHAERSALVRHTGLSVIEKSQWAGEHVSEGRLLVVAQLNDEATDAEWLDTLEDSDGDEKLAIASMEDRFGATEADAKKPDAAPAAAKSSTVQQKHNDQKPASLAPKPK